MLPVVLQADFKLVNRIVDRPNGFHSMAAKIVRGVIQVLSGMAQGIDGHRVEAIGAIDNAIHQLEICLKYDR